MFCVLLHPFLTAWLLATGEHRAETIFGITRLTPEQASPQHLLTLLRGYWGIENGLHYRRDKTMHEDATRISHPQQAQVIAILNNLVIGVTQRLGLRNLAAARRYFAANLNEAITLVVKTFP